jgi:hypothetical protein
MQPIHRQNLEKETVELSPDELAALDEGIRSSEEDRRYTVDEALEFARKRRKEWMKAPTTASA